MFFADYPAILLAVTKNYAGDTNDFAARALAGDFSVSVRDGSMSLFFGVFGMAGTGQELGQYEMERTFLVL